MCRLLLDRVEERTKETIVDVFLFIKGRNCATFSGKTCGMLFFDRWPSSVPMYLLFLVALSLSTTFSSQSVVLETVRILTTVYDAFDLYCAADVLDDDNKYNTDDFGPQVRLFLIARSKTHPICQIPTIIASTSSALRI